MSEKTYKYRWHISTGYAGDSHSGRWEFEEKPTEDELEQLLKEAIFNHVDSSYEEIEDE